MTALPLPLGTPPAAPGTETGAAAWPLRVAVVVPCYRCKDQVLRVLQGLGPEVWRVFVVDDACPEGTGPWVRAQISDARVLVIDHPSNQGVGAAVTTGYAAALQAGADIVVKIDGDGQMDPSLVPRFIEPIALGRADYTKGNRFFTLRSLKDMPGIRLLGNAGLSFLAKLSTGYWSLFDVTNGYTAIHARLLPYMELDKVSRRYFFETDMLFRLGTLRAAVVDVPMEAVYADERSNLRIWRVFPEFVWKNLVNLGKRLAYNYFLRDMSVASIELLAGSVLLLFGVVFGLSTWSSALATGIPTPLGTIMLAALPTLVGLQMLLAFIGHDVAQQPKAAVHPLLPAPGAGARQGSKP
jgi:glycosyltransferase involved in cell wall biosynthesis